MIITILILALCIVLLAVGLLLTILKGKGTKSETNAGKEDNTVEKKSKVDMKESVSDTDRELFVRCCRYMELRKPFLVEKFSLEDLALAMFTNKLYLSQTINACTGRNFRAFVNGYRVLYAMDLFRKNNRLRVSDLSNLSGFHTPVSFNMAFKLIMDEAPGAWCARERLQMQRKGIIKQ